MKPTAAVIGAVFVACLLLPAPPAWAKAEPSRTITVRLAVDHAIPNLTEWRFQANSFLEGTVRTFLSHFGIRLAFKGPVRWQPGAGRKPLEDELRDLSVKVRPDGCDIVLGIIDPDRVSSRSLGIASYVNACILIGNSEDAGIMRYAVLHEICHVFGAIDLGQKGSLMSIKGGKLDFDQFTTDAVLLHRDRTFSRGAFPLQQDDLDAAIRLYQEREVLHFGEPETNMFLTLLYLEKNDLDGALRASEEAAKEGPNMLGLEVLLGNVCLGRGQPDQAVVHYERALVHHPADAGLRYNLALAYANLGRSREAAQKCRESLRIDPGLVAAKLGLAGAFQIARAFPLCGQKTDR